MSSSSSLVSMAANNAKPPIVESKSNSSNSGNGGGKPDGNVELKGWINKWTNYLKGYQKRWFVLSNGVLSYYRNQAEVGHTCRGSINLQGAFIHTEDAFTFVVSNGGTQTFHLKASNEVERQRWVTALELARVRAIRAAESDEDEEIKLENETSEVEKGELQSTIRSLQSKLEDLTTCQQLITNHGSSLQRSLSEVEQLQNNPEWAAKVRTINERATLYRITTNAMINACNEFVQLAQTQGKKWQRMLQFEHDQRVRLQEQLEQLARQHSALERAAMKEVHEHSHMGGLSALSDEETEIFHDAPEEITDFTTYTTNEGGEMKSGQFRRSPSEISGHDHEDDDNVGQPTAEERAKAAKLLQCKFVTRSDSKAEPADELAVQQRTVKSTRKRRTSIPLKPNVSVSLWSIMKNCIGKELSKIPMPVNFNEPLSMLQRLAEDFEYAHILDRAAQCTDTCEQMCFVAAFTVSSYSTTTNRTSKPFNPLLGETFECDRSDDLGWRSVAEQVSHHPPAAAMYTEGRNGWICWQEFTMSSKFRGKYLSIIPLGISHLEFKGSGNHYTWRKVTTTVHNIIVGKLWIDNHGEMTIENHKTGDKCHLKYIPYSYFSRDTPRKVTGVVTDKSGNVRWVIQGTWDDHIECAKVVGQSGKNVQDKTVFETLPPKLIWKRNPLLPGSENFYFFTQLAIELNETEPGVAPTDSRLRPDQRHMEIGEWDQANAEKLRIEEKQRATRRKREAEAEQAMVDGKPYKDNEPVWFVKQKDQWTGNLIHMFTNQYWDAKGKQDWSRCPDIY